MYTKNYFEHESENGYFTRKNIVEIICNDYKKIYEEERDTTSEMTYKVLKEHQDICEVMLKALKIDKEENAKNEEKKNKEKKKKKEGRGKYKSFSLNRPFTDGKYAIWGHYISDLILEFVKVKRNVKGDIMLELIISS